MSSARVTPPHPELTPEALTEIYAHARREHPNECCGIVFGPKQQPIAGRAEPPRIGLATMGAVNVYTREVADHLVTVVGEAPAASVQRIGNRVEFRQPQ